MERKIGEEFEYNGVKLKVVEADGCDECYFRHITPFASACSLSKHYNIHGCCNIARGDRKSVQFIKVEKMKEETKSLPIPEGWEFAGYENGEIKIRKAEPELPTDYEKALGAVKVSEIRSLLVPSGMYGAVSALCKLLIYRNAWWQKLGWKPDFENGLIAKYVISNWGGKLDIGLSGMNDAVLAFPTEEVRDKFAETFKDLVEEAKELL